MDFHGFRVPQDCVSHLKAVFSSRGDFIQGFCLGYFAREHFLKLLGSVMNDIEHNFVDIVSSERILQWRVAVQELISVDFAVEFILDLLREIARAFFMKKVQPVVDTIDTRIETLKKEKNRKKKKKGTASTKPRDKRLVSKVAGPTNASKKMLTTTLQVCHLLLQSLNSCVSSIYNGLNLFHEKGSGNLTKMV